MSKFRCIQRLSTDGGKTVHEVGEIVELSDSDAETALRLSAVEPVADQANVQELKQEIAQLQEEVQQAEEEQAPVEQAAGDAQ